MKKTAVIFLMAAFCLAGADAYSASPEALLKCPAFNGQLSIPQGPEGNPAIGGKIAWEQATSHCPALNGQLNQDQIKQVSGMFTNYYNTIGPIRATIINKRNQLAALLNGPTADKAQVETLSRELGELGGKLISARIELQNQLQKLGVSPQALDLRPATLPAQGPNPASPYNWGGPADFNQRDYGMGNPYRQGFGPGYTGNPAGPGMGMMNWQ